VFTYPEIDPVFLSIGPISLRWYGLMYAIAFAIALYLGRRRAKAPWSVVKPDQTDDLVFWTMLGIVIGGRLGYVFFYGWNTLLADPLFLVRFTDGGMSFHGGLVGAMAAIWLYGKKLRVPTLALWDFIAPLTPLGLFFGRIGNFINGELWGKPTELPWGFLVHGEVLHPSMLYEAFLEGLVLFAIVWTYSSKPRPVMAVSGLFSLGYGSFRFSVEFVRVPDDHLGYLAFDWLTMGQILSTPMILVGATMMALAYARQPAPGPEAS
jgi:phosphatidylglycerol:prolipoprotein diacylglycerol transferase